MFPPIEQNRGYNNQIHAAFVGLQGSLPFQHMRECSPLLFGLGQVSQTHLEVIVSGGELTSHIRETVHLLNLSAFNVEGGEVAELLRQLFLGEASHPPFPALLTYCRLQMLAARLLSPHILETMGAFFVPHVTSNV